MDDQKIKAMAEELVRDAIRNSEAVHGSMVFSGVPDLVDSVVLDREKMRMRVEALLNKKTGNPINALLGLLGLRIVNIQKTAEQYVAQVEYIDDDTEFGSTTASNPDSMMVLHEEQFTAAVEKMIENLYRIERRYESDAQDYRDQISRLIGKLNDQERAHNQLIADHASLKKNVLSSIQQILCEAGPQSASPEAAGAAELLEDLGAKAYWSAEGAPFSESAMFVILKYDEPEKLKMKPCLADANAVLMKGVKFVAAQPEG